MSKIEISGETYKIKLPISPFLNPGSFLFQFFHFRENTHFQTAVLAKIYKTTL